MPIYAYKCESCGLSKDVLQKMSDATLTECPACGKSSFVKQLTAAGFQLKGSGWYATDFKGGATATPATDGKSEVKSEPKTEGASTGSDSKSGGDSATTAPSTTKTDASPAASAGSCKTGCACH